MLSKDIREKFLDFFRERGHTIIPSDLLVPANDPSLLFTGAGMNQFKEQFLGRNITYSRAASSQKCIRTGDLENVGKTPRHHTFFEMLGNFSFGDYFKKEAIAWGWEFMTEELGVPAERLWITVYEKDDESYSIWVDEIKIPAERVIKLGTHDNFWPADAPEKGPNGPCGPCSEIFYDWGSDKGCGKDTCDPSCDCGRFVEVWNLVFTEFERRSDGALDPLPNKNIDTGMGLERITSVIQGVGSNFETDLFKDINEHVRKETGGTGKELAETDIHLISDHIRSVTFAIADGVSPSNESRGYVIRKLIRRAFLKSGRKDAFLYNLVPSVVNVMKDFYPELEEKREHISSIVADEENRFSDTLNSAMPVMEEMVSRGPKSLAGEQIFKLVDTYGLPVDIITEEAERTGVKLDLETFERLMEGRKEQSRKGSDMAGGSIFKPDHFLDAPRPSFSEDMPLEASLEFILKDGAVSDEISEGERAEIITSPQSAGFYAEAGGQVGDTGEAVKDGGLIKITNTFNADGRKVFRVFVKKGHFNIKDAVTVTLDSSRKGLTARNHTATHLLQAALRSVLGDNVKQSGSFVDSGRLRFDFTHMKKLSERELRKVEDMVNGWIAESIPVNVETMSIDEAKEKGALSFFGEKYGDVVRIVSVGGQSKEFCGGTHVDNTADIKVIKIVNEASVASGVRRIEAVTAEGVGEWIKKYLSALRGECNALGLGPGGVIDDDTAEYADRLINGSIEIDKDIVRDFEEKIKPAFLDARDALKKASKKQQKEKLNSEFNNAMKKLDPVIASSCKQEGITFVSDLLEDTEMSGLRKAAAYVEKKIGSGVVFLGGEKEGKAYIVCVVTEDIASSGIIDAREMINAAAGSINGAGGGKPTFATAGGKKPKGLAGAIEEARKIVGSRVKG